MKHSMSTHRVSHHPSRVREKKIAGVGASQGRTLADGGEMTQEYISGTYATNICIYIYIYLYIYILYIHTYTYIQSDIFITIATAATNHRE